MDIIPVSTIFLLYEYDLIGGTYISFQCVHNNADLRLRKVFASKEEISMAVEMPAFEAQDDAKHI